MNVRTFRNKTLTMALLILLQGFALTVQADNEPVLSDKAPITPSDKIERVIEVIEEQMSANAEKRISSALLNNAQCIVIIPDMFQAGLGLGFKHGNGVISCRHDEENTWGIPMFVRLTGASVGTQLGVQTMDVLMLAMTDNGLNQLLSGKPIASGDAGVTLGPIGRNAEIALDVLMQTPLLSYTRSKGLYAGASLGGSIFTPATKANTEVYGAYEDARTLLLERQDVPEEVQALVDILNNYTSVQDE